MRSPALARWSGFSDLGQRDGDQGVRGDLAHEARGHVEYSVDAVIVCDRDDRLASPYDLAGLGAVGDHDTRGIRQKLGVAELVLGHMQLRLGDINSALAVWNVLSAAS